MLMFQILKTVDLFLIFILKLTNPKLFNSKLLNLANRRNSKENDKFSKINTNSHLSGNKCIFYIPILKYC